MAKVSRESAEVMDAGIVEDLHGVVEGYTVNFVTLRQDIDHTPLLKGLPDDRCQCPHWGYVLKGRWTVRYADHDEVLDEGDAYYMPPGHIPLHNEPGTQILQFSPTVELRETEAAIGRNLEALQAS